VIFTFYLGILKREFYFLSWYLKVSQLKYLLPHI